MPPGEMDFRLTEAELRSIVERGAILTERVAAPVASPPADGYLANWRQTAARGDDESFRRVLAWRGLSEGALGGGVAATPAWGEQLRRMLAGADAAAASLDPAPPDGLGEHLWRPIAEAALRPLRARLLAVGEDPAVMDRPGHRLLGIISHIAQSVAAETGLVATDPLGWLRGTRPADGFPRAILLRYPALARALAVFWGNWLDAECEFLDRLAADRPALAGFLGHRGPVKLASLQSTGDPHNAGRTVMLVGFADGSSVVYKSRPVALDAAFHRLLAWVNAEAGLPDLACPRVLDRGEYGWAEFIPHRPAEPEEVAPFWQRAGLLLGLAHLLNATDLHFENLIASGAYPVPVDLETVIQPCPLNNEVTREAYRVAAPTFWPGYDIIAVGLLPLLQRVNLPGGSTLFADLGAFGAPGGPDSQHRPGEATVEADLLAHAGEIADGLGRMLRFLASRRDELGRAGGPLDAFQGLPVRHVFRDTSLYFRLGLLSCHASFMADGRARDIALERLARPLLRQRQRPAFTPVIDAEKRALNDLDIPFFFTLADSVDLHDRHGLVAPGLFAESALAAARQRLAALDETHIRRQQRIVGLTLQARVADGAAAAPSPEPALAEAPAALRAARTIGEAVAALAEPSPAGGLAWLALQHHVAQDLLSYAGPTFGLGDGAAGIVLFLTELAAASGDPATAAWRDGGLSNLDAVADLLLAQPSLPPSGCDLLAGAAGVAAVLARCGTKAGRPGSVTRGVALIERIASERAETLDDPTLASGLAGLVLACLAIADSPGAPDLGERLGGWGAALAERGPAVTVQGLLQGRAGIALALGRLAAHLDAPRLRLAARGLLPDPEAAAGLPPTLGAGAAGWLLAALAADETELAARLAAALSRAAPDGNDSLLRGAAGIAWSLRAAGCGGEPAERLERRLAARAVAGSLAPVTPRLAGAVVPGLLNGVCGIGLCLLRPGASWFGFA
jgi:hypothetical protein